MAKKAKKSRKNKALKVDQAKQELAQETVSASTVIESTQEAGKPVEVETAPAAAAAVPIEDNERAIETPEPTEKKEKKPAAKKSTPAAKAKTEPKAKKAEDAAKTSAGIESAAPKTTKKTPAVKAEPAKKPGRKPMTAAEKAANAKARAEEKKKADAMTPTLTMQYGGRDIDVKALVQAAKDDFKANHKRTLLTELNLYLKPEDSTLYYVANGSAEGKIRF